MPTPCLYVMVSVIDEELSLRSLPSSILLRAPTELECDFCDCEEFDSVFRCFTPLSRLSSTESAALRFAPSAFWGLPLVIGALDRFVPLAVGFRIPLPFGFLCSPFVLSEALESLLVTVSCRFLKPFVIPSPLGVSAPGLTRCTPTFETSDVVRGRAAPSGEGTFGLLLRFCGLS